MKVFRVTMKNIQEKVMKMMFGMRRPVVFHTGNDNQLVENCKIILDTVGYKQVEDKQLNKHEKDEMKKLVGTSLNLDYPCIYVKVEPSHQFLGRLSLWAAGCGIVVAGLTAVLAVPALLAAVGFASGGVASGSIAATIQAIFYKGSTTGVFSFLQSIGASGLGFGNVAVGGGASSMTYYFGKSKKDSDTVTWDSTKNALTLQVYAFIRLNKQDEDKELIKQHIMKTFALNVDVTPVSIDYIKKTQFNHLAQSQGEVAPACLISVNLMK